ncbi:MAG: transglutaminase domain-containing protein [Oscillospiraceae bacterium]
MKKRYAFLIITALLLDLTGCAPDRISDTNLTSPSVDPTARIVSPSAVPAEPSTPAPELQYTFDPYVLPSDARAYLGDALSDYRHLVDAVLQRQETVSLPEDSLSKAVSCLLAEFPLSALIHDFNYDWENASVTFSYLYDRDEHEARIQAFEKRVQQAVRASVLPAGNDCEEAISLYRWTAQNIRYLDGGDISVYHALMDGEGICQSYAGAYQFLLLQVGIDALGAGAFMNDGGAHEWTMVSLGGRWFHMDPTFEDSLDGGDGLTFFGMDDIRRGQSGVETPFTTGIDEWCTTAPACEDDCFRDLNACLYWERDTAASCIRLSDGVSEEPYADLDTDAYEICYYQ